MFEVGAAKIHTELDVVKVIRNLKNLRTIMKTQLMKDEDMLKILHNDNNIIDMDVSPCSSENGAELQGL